MRFRIRVDQAAALLVMAAAFVIPPERIPDLPVCWMKSLFGVPCPGCGMTHALCALGHGRFAEAWASHPFSFLLFPLGLLYVLPALIKKGTSSWLGGGLWVPTLIGALFVAWGLRFL